MRRLGLALLLTIGAGALSACVSDPYREVAERCERERAENIAVATAAPALAAPAETTGWRP